MTQTARLAGALAAALALALGAPAAAQDTGAQAAAAPEEAAPPPGPIDPEAMAILREAAEYIAAQPAIGLDWFVSYDVVIEGREKITYLRSGHNLLERGVGFYSWAESGDEVREYFFDGQSVTIREPENGVYVSAPFEGSFDELVDRLRAEYGIAVPIWQMLSATSADDLLAGTEAAAWLGITRFAGREAHHLAFSNRDRDWQAWISTDPDAPLPLMIVGTNPYEQGWPQFRAYFSDWDFAPEIAESAFTFVPGEEDIRASWPKLAEAAVATAEGPSDGTAPAPAADTGD